KIELLKAKVTNTASRKRKAVTLDPNIKFITIIELEASKVKSDIDKSAASDLLSEAKSCIIMALRGC
ncbi:hypothetical protein LX32DRAFT_605908, partial [Colletotrichum zoysiae]